MIKDKLPDMPAAAQKELAELIENRLIADKIVLKEGGAEAVRLWKAEAKEIISEIEETSKHTTNWFSNYLTQAEKQTLISDLAYLKKLNLQDAALQFKIDEILSKLPPDMYNEFLVRSRLFDEVLLNV